MTTQPNLREQIIEAIKKAPEPDQHYGAAECLFDHHIMPVLQAAMDAGELLVSRNTKTREPIAKRVDTWVRAVIDVADDARKAESTVSKRELLRVLYFLAEQAQAVVRDINENAHVI